MKLNLLINKAEDAGFTVVREPYAVQIYKVDCRNGRIKQGVWICIDEKGRFVDATRTDIDLTLALNIRTVKAVAGILGLL